MDISMDFPRRELLDRVIRDRIDFVRDPIKIYPWWRRCTVRALIVTDGGLDFGGGDFGLSTFVQSLLDHPAPNMDFALTLGHLRSDVSDAQMLAGDPRIARRIKGLRFDQSSHFNPDDFDEIWLFGIETWFHRSNYAARNAANSGYPADRLGDGELVKLAEFMNGGGGVFATGDHGALGRGLCGSVQRVRNMRWWNSFSVAGNPEDQVSMSGPWRNDTNRIGHDAGSQFSDQSDDVPQALDLRLYTSYLGRFTNAVYPHPIFCGPQGRINVFPDHPHEGECKSPDNPNLDYDWTGLPEYPAATGPGPRPLPEVIAFSHVPAGNTASNSKQPTVAHSFGASSAYDGHKAGVGRVVCDATWHHFVNVNLIGIVEGGGFDEFGRPGEDPTKHLGFLSTPAGREALAKIQTYYGNVAGWIARPERIVCARNRLWWIILWKDRVMEAALVDPDVALEKIDLTTLRTIGIHARDVIGRLAGQCQSLRFLLDEIHVVWREMPPWLDPWEDPREKPFRDDLPLTNPLPLLEAMLGGALVAMRQAMPYPSEKIADGQEKEVIQIGHKAAARVLDRGRKVLAHEVRALESLFDGKAGLE